VLSINVAHQKTLRDNPCYTVQFSSSLFRNGVPRQVAEKIAQCSFSFVVINSKTTTAAAATTTTTTATTIYQSSKRNYFNFASNANLNFYHKEHKFTRPQRGKRSNPLKRIEWFNLHCSWASI